MARAAIISNRVKPEWNKKRERFCLLVIGREEISLSLASVKLFFYEIPRALYLEGMTREESFQGRLKPALED